MQRLIRMGVVAGCVMIVMVAWAGVASAQDDDSGYQLGDESGYQQGDESGYGEDGSGYADSGDTANISLSGTNVGLAVGANAGAIALGVALDRKIGRRGSDADSDGVDDEG